MINKKFLLMFWLMLAMVKGYSQYEKSASPQPEDEGLSLKFALGRGNSLSYDKLSFSGNSGQTLDLRLGPGAGYNFAIGTTLGTPRFDFDLLLEESIILGYHASSSYSSSGSYSQSFLVSFFKTNIYTTAYFKLYKEGSRNKFRIGAGPFMMLPGKFKVAIDKEDLGYSSYKKQLGYQFDTNMILSVSSFFINPGIRVKIIRLESKKITFTDNRDQLNSLNASSIDFYLAIIL